MKVLIAVASKHGSTREIASVIGDELRKADIDVDLKDADKVSEITGYDAVILGSGIYAGNWLPEAKHFAEQYRSELANIPLWVFSSGPLGSPDAQPQDDPAKIATSLGELKPHDHHIFAGKLDLDTLGFGERMITKVVHAPEGDFRDWNEISAWAGEIAAELSPVPAK